MTNDDILKGLYDNTIIGKAAEVKDLTQKGLDAGLEPIDLLYKGLIPALQEVGRRFEIGDFFVPEMLLSAKAMQGALTLLKPLLAAKGEKTLGKIVMGTVKGDVHDIGKNLCNIMLEGAGFEVFDLGVNTTPENLSRRFSSINLTSWAFPVPHHDDAHVQSEYRGIAKSRAARQGESNGWRGACYGRVRQVVGRRLLLPGC
jgi:methanogenic corrinoid protein MtbC1